MSHVRELLARDPLDLTESDRTRIAEHQASCAECCALAAALARTDRMLMSAEPRLTVPPLRGRSAEQTSPLLLAGVGAIALIAVLALVPILAGRADRAAAPASSPSPSAAVAASPTPARSPTPTASPAATPRLQGVFDNSILGYRLTPPDGYRVERATLVRGDQEELGGDSFTALTEAEARQECEQDHGHFPPPRPRPDLRLSAFRNPQRLSASDWATTPRRGGFVWSTHQRVESVATPRDAVRLVSIGTGETTSYLIAASDRIYALSISSSRPSGAPTLLDEVARTFVAIRPTAFPTPTPARDATADAAAAAAELARAFSARDADAVARMSTGCWISYSHTIDGEAPGQGGQGRSVPRFAEGLRERFARGDLTVTVDPTVRTGRNGRFVRSEWREPDRMRVIDLYLSERDGRWVWDYAQHHYLRGDFEPPGCMNYRVPWSSVPGC